MACNIEAPPVLVDAHAGYRVYQVRRDLRERPEDETVAQYIAAWQAQSGIGIDAVTTQINYFVDIDELGL